MFAAPILLILIISLLVLKLVALLEILDKFSTILADSTWSVIHGLHPFNICLRLDNLTRSTPRNKIDGVVLELVFARHLWVLNDSLLRAWLRLLCFLGACLGFNGRIVHLGLLFTRAIHSVEHLSDVIMTAKVLV